MANRPVNILLDQLTSAAAETAWKAFLDDYGPIIFYVVRTYEREEDRVNDCFLYICEEFSKSGFRRLRRFRCDGPATFGTWLRVVTSNLCIDWRRKELGRIRPFRAITRLPALDQLVFRAMFERGMTRRECWQSLQSRFPDLSEQRLSDVIRNLHTVLTSRQHWLLSARNAQVTSLSEPAFSDGTGVRQEPQDSGPGPEMLAELAQERTDLLRAMSHLTSRQRLLLRLRFQDDLTLKEIARLTGLKDPFRAKRQIQTALDALQEQLTVDDDTSLRKIKKTVRVKT